MNATPYLADVGVLAFVPDRWDTPWQPRHQVLSRLARYFHVVWVTPPEWWRYYFRTRAVTAERSTPFTMANQPGLSIFLPPTWLPEIGRPRFLAAWTTAERLRRARQILEQRGCDKTVAYVWRPAFGDLLSLVPHDISCYHIDDEYSFSEVERPLDPREAHLIADVDQVFIHSPALLRKKGHLNPNTAFVPNGVDYKAFTTPHGEPHDLASIPHPRVGYVGRIKRQLDLELVRSLARRHVTWSFVLVGPVEDLSDQYVVLRELEALPNVHLLGGKPVQRLPAYTQHLDVCMLCYDLNDYTKFIYPLKLHEYLAAGRPIVGSPIESLLGFSNVVRLARGVDEWSWALSECLNDSARSRTEIETRRRVAHDHDWDRLVARIAGMMAQHLGDPYSKRLADALASMDQSSIDETVGSPT